MLIFILLFLSFFQIGFLGIGGYASTQALIEHEVITLHHWLTPAQMADLMTFCRALPGGTGLNSATMASALTVSGQYGMWGCVAASCCTIGALIVPSAFWTAFYSKIQEQDKYKSFYECAMVVLRPLVPGLIAAAAILMMRPDTFGTPTTTPWDFMVSIFLFLATLIGIGVYKFNALFMVVLCGLAGCVLY